MIRPSTQAPQPEDLQTVRKADEEISAMPVSVEPMESQLASPSVSDAANPLHMLAFAAEGTLGGEASAARGEAVDSGDGDLDADAEGETDTEDNYDTMRLTTEQNMDTSQSPLPTLVSQPAVRVSVPFLTAPSDSRVSPKPEAIRTDKDEGHGSEPVTDLQKREKDRAMEAIEVAPVAAQRSENADAVPATTSSIASPRETLLEPSQSMDTASEALDSTSYMHTPRQPTIVPLKQHQEFTELTKDPAEDVTMADPDMVHVSSPKLEGSSVPASNVEMNTLSRPGASASADPVQEPIKVAGAGGIDAPDKLQFMGAMGDRSLQRHLRELEKAAHMQKKSEEAASSSAPSLPTAEAKRRKLAPKQSQVVTYAKPIKEELEVDGDIWKALALDEAREKQAETSSAAHGKPKTKGKAGKAKKQQLEQAEINQNAPVSSSDLMDIDSGSLLAQDEPREKKKAAKRGARVCL